MPTVYILFNTRFAYYQIRCKNNRELNNWFDALECRREQLRRDLSVSEKEQIRLSFFKIKSLSTIPFLSLAVGSPYFSVVRKDTTIFLDLSRKLFSSDYHKKLDYYSHILTVNFIDNDKNN